MNPRIIPIDEDCLLIYCLECCNGYSLMKNPDEFAGDPCIFTAGDRSYSRTNCSKCRDVEIQNEGVQ